MTDLATFIATTPLADTHEHLNSEEKFLAESPDVLQDLFDHYTQADLRVAGASPEALKKLTDANDPDLAGRFLGIRAAWEAIQLTGYGEAVRLTAWQAAWRLDRGLPCDEALFTAKFWAAEGGWRVMHAAHHLHGGVGVDRDYPLHRHFLNHKQLELLVGSATPSLRHLGALLAGTPHSWRVSERPRLPAPE